MSARVVWRRSEDVAHVESPGRVALLHLGHLERPPMILEGSSAVIWDLLDGDRDQAALTQAVAEHFDVARDRDRGAGRILPRTAAWPRPDRGSMSGSSSTTKHAVTVNALDVVVRIETDQPRLAAALETAWAWCLVDPVAPPAVTVQADGALTDGSPLEAVMEQLTQLVTIEAVGQQAGELLMLHACALANPATGDAVLLVGPSGMGKTTLAATLGCRWAYLSDETAGVTGAGALVGYPKPLSVHSGAHPGKDQVSPGALGLLPMVGPARVGAVVLLSRDREAVETLVEEVPTVPAIALLAEHTSYLSTLERPLHRMADLLAEAGGLKRVTYREAKDLAPLVAELIGEGT